VSKFGTDASNLSSMMTGAVWAVAGTIARSQAVVANMRELELERFMTSSRSILLRRESHKEVKRATRQACDGCPSPASSS
jgi:hypothetical protein